MERRVSKKPNLVTRVLGGAAVAAGAVLGAQSANAGRIFLNDDFGSVDAPKVFLWHESLTPKASDGYDSSYDSVYTPGSPKVDFFSQITDITDYKLTNDKRDISSTTTYHTILQGNGLDYTGGEKKGTLTFAILNDSVPISDFPEHIWADVYKNNSLVVGNINVRDYAQNNTTVPLNLASNSDVYNINVRFVPEGGTLGMLGAGALAAGSFGLYNLLTRRKEEDPKA